MIAVLTGDIIDSTHQDKALWLPALQSVLTQWGQEEKDWEIYRGDEFQLRLPKADSALEAAFAIKARLKAKAQTDIRIAIGIGSKQPQTSENHPGSRPSTADYKTRLTQSSGQAFILSGRKLDDIKSRRIQLAVASTSSTWDQQWNLMLQWALLSADHWSTGSAEIVDLALSRPELSQNEMARILKIAQPAVSQRLKRSSFDLLQQTLTLFKDKIQALCSQA